MRKLGAIVVALLGLPLPLICQTQRGAWASLYELRVGRKIELVETNLKQHHGSFVAVTDDLITLKETGTEVSVKRGDVMRVSVSSGSGRGKHALIGFFVGGAAGAAIGTATASKGGGGFLNIDIRGIGALVGLAIGAPSGALVGAALPSHKTLYRSTVTVPGTHAAH